MAEFPGQWIAISKSAGNKKLSNCQDQEAKSLAVKGENTPGGERLCSAAAAAQRGGHTDAEQPPVSALTSLCPE